MADQDDLGPCLVLRVQTVREADVIVTLLHPLHGRVDAVARGARSSRKRFGAALAPFRLVHARLGRGRGQLPVLAEATLLQEFLRDGTGYPQLALASYATELAQHASQPDHADPGLFQWLQGVWTQAGQPIEGQLRALRLQAEVTFLRELGAFPDVRACASCHGSTGQGAVWPDASSGLLCLTCAGNRTPRLSADLLDALALSQFSTLDPHALRPVEERVAQLIGQVIAAPLRSAQALRSLVAFDTLD
jgi:DNA repair protein RecO (recombination protein O)